MFTLLPFIVCDGEEKVVPRPATVSWCQAELTLAAQ
jgi:hypothetical protein